MPTVFNLKATASIVDNKLVIHDSTNYPGLAQYAFNRIQFTNYSAFIITKPNNAVDIYCTQDYATYNNIIPREYISPISQLTPDIIVDTDKAGLFTIEYIACPTTPAPSLIIGYLVGDVVYSNGQLYKCITAGGALIQNFEITTPDQVYNYTFTKVYTSDIDACMRAKIDRATCLLKEDPNRNDLCSNPLFTEIFTLDNIRYQLDNIVTSSPEYSKTLRYMLAYLNSKCCCEVSC